MYKIYVFDFFTKKNPCLLKNKFVDLADFAYYDGHLKVEQ